MIFWKKKENKEESFGARGETLAAEYLEKKGYKILDRNYKNDRGKRLGEIDIVARKDGKIVFVEVKTRSLENYESTLPEANITYAKLRKLAKIGQIYIKAHKLWDKPYQFDAVSIWLSADYKDAKIKHIESIFI